MEIMSDLLIGFHSAFSLGNIIYCFVGVLLGTLIGILPGLGPTATIAMLLPLTFSMSPDTALIMLAGIYYGAQYGGSTSAILINLPGEASTAVTAIDGYQMARNGRAGPALAIAAIGSFVAGTFATIIIVLAAPALASIAIEFGSVEYFSLIVFGLIASISLARGSILKALTMIIFGLLLGIVGTDVYTGAQRFTFGYLQLMDGLNVIAIATGVFGISEILRNLENEVSRTSAVHKVGRLWPSRDDLRMCVGSMLRGTAIGSFLGVLPGGGALLSSFASYTIEKKFSSSPQRFGYGAIEGVAGPESANNAGSQTSFIPMLTLGIPSNSVMALMVGALIIQGITPGPGVISEHPDLFWGLIVSMWLGNLMLLVLNLPLVGLWVKLLTIPYYSLFPAIIVFSAMGVYSISANSFDLYALAIFGLIGYLLMKLDCEPAPLLLGFILGPMLEEHLRRALMLSRGDLTTFVTSPISALFLVLSGALLLMMTLPTVGKKREEIFSEE